MTSTIQMNQNNLELSNKKYNKRESNDSPQVQFDNLVNLYWQNNPYIKNVNLNHELEVRFGTRGIKPINKIDYDNVIKKLKSLGFTSANEEGGYMLRIQNEFLDSSTGRYKLSNIRTEINGFQMIQDYCKDNDIKKLMSSDSYSGSNVEFHKKTPYKLNNGENIYPVNFDDFNFRVSYQTEERLSSTTGVVRNIIDNWERSKKSFRYINRVTFSHPEIPVNVDISIVKNSSFVDKRLKLVYTTSESNVFENMEMYEIELEVNNSLIGPGTIFQTPELLLMGIRKSIKYILMGLQGTNYPISYKEQIEILHEYMKLIHIESGKYNPEKRIYPSDFIGPSSYTLQLQNIAPLKNNNTNFPNINNDYMVTEKADGERHMMFISKKGKIYLLNTNMNVLFTGVETENNNLFNSLVDGEVVLHDKHGKFINLYASFDIRIESKKFLPGGGSTSIFSACKTILDNNNQGLFEYNTDGLIFTPKSMGVGADQIGKAGPLSKSTWDYSFKWKPPQYNTVDFLVSTKKGENGVDLTTPVFQDGTNTSSLIQLNEYKTIILRCGFDERKHGFLNPCQDVIDDKLPSVNNLDNEDNYKPVQFFPTDPFDPLAGICNIMLEKDDTGVNQMFTEEKQVFGDNTIVEFRYEMDNKEQWRWIPLRVRYDKTAELKQGLKNYGNAYHVANNNWHSIHNPITEDMISTGNNIPDEIVDEDVYYNRTSSLTLTRGLRDFHNLFVKKMLITSVSKKGNTLIDYACGKGGDFPKWISAQLSFVFGIDISKDNLENQIDGACARFLKFKKTNKIMPNALFVNGNSSANIKSGAAMLNDKAIQITKAVFGDGPKDEEKLGKGVYKQYGKGEDGFDVSSCQFAIHYFFENQLTFQNFMRNIAECTKLGGYFIGTCYDGKKIFDLLKNKKEGESINIYDGDHKIWEIQKDYDKSSFNDDDVNSLGYKINVYQESINKIFSEYLVNFNYLERIIQNYGFKLLTHDEAKEIGLPNGSGMFSELFHLMENEVKRNKSNKINYGDSLNMSANEKSISFLNRYFVYKKIAHVNSEKVSIELMDDVLINEENGENEEIKNVGKNKNLKKTKTINKKLEKTKMKPKKIDKKLILIDSDEPDEPDKPYEVEIEREKGEKEIDNTENIEIEKISETEKPKKITRTPKKLKIREEVSIIPSEITNIDEDTSISLQIPKKIKKQKLKIEE